MANHDFLDTKSFKRALFNADGGRTPSLVGADGGALSGDRRLDAGALSGDRRLEAGLENAPSLSQDAGSLSCDRRLDARALSGDRRLDGGALSGDRRLDAGLENAPVLRKHYVADEIREIGDADDRVLSFTIATNVIDRHGDRVDPAGFRLDAYRANPVVLFAHDTRQPPIARTRDIQVSGGRLKADAQFMDAAMDRYRGGFADSVYRMLKGGFLQATSVGFRPVEFERLRDEGGEATDGILFKTQDLLEFSIVPVPANPQALIEARSAGIDMAPYLGWVEEAVDDWAQWKGVCMVPKRFMEVLLRETGVGKTRFVLPAGAQDALRRANLATMRAGRVPGRRSTGDRIEDRRSTGDRIEDRRSTGDRVEDRRSSAALAKKPPVVPADLGDLELSPAEAEAVMDALLRRVD